MEITIEKIEGEMRDGYFVPPLMKRFWLSQLEVLSQIDAICTRHSLRYYASWGTALGAVRHKGFIPWDDDIDINMPRRDYELFKKYCKTELESPMALGEAIAGNFNNIISRVVNTEHTYCLDQDFLSHYHGCPYQSGIDIFCVDHIPDDPEADELLCNLVKAACGVGYHWNDTDSAEREEQLAFLEEVTGFPCPEGRHPRVHCLYLADRLSAMYMDEDSAFSAIIYYYYDNPRRKMPTESLSRIIRVPFEQVQIPILEDYDQYLTNMFGDYKTPVRWGEHVYVKSCIEELRKNLGEIGQSMPPEFDLISE